MSANAVPPEPSSPSSTGAARAKPLLTRVLKDRRVREVRRRAVALTHTAADALAERRPPGYPVPLTDPKKQCLVCGGTNMTSKSLTFKTEADLKCRVRICHDCSFVQVVRPGVDHYSALTSLDQMGVGSRVGTIARPGREFYIGEMGAQILGGRGLDVLISGAGRSMDNHHLSRLKGVAKVAIGDIMRLRDDAEFVDVLAPPPRQFDLVIASEVVEHFRRPRRDFRGMLRFVKDDGLLLCGTSLNLGHPLEGCRYIFYPDHTALYSPDSLRLVAQANGFHLDFRSPLMGSKRYLFFSKSAAVMERVSTYFGQQSFAASEVIPRFGEPRRKNAAGR